MSMAPFQFPDPSVSQSVIHPTTGETWVYENGIWIVQDSPTNPDSDNTDTTNEELEALILNLRNEISDLQTDIIELRAQLTAATVNNFLILE